MSQKKEKGNRLDSIPRLGKQVWRRANLKESRRKLLVDRITEVLKLASGENGDDEVGSKLEDESAVHCPSAQAGGYSANWRVLFKQLGIEASRKKQQAGTSPEHDHGSSTEAKGMDVVSIATTSKSRQFHRRRKKASSLKKKKQDIGRTPVESMNLSPKGGPKVRDEVVSMNPHKGTFKLQRVQV